MAMEAAKQYEDEVSRIFQNPEEKKLEPTKFFSWRLRPGSRSLKKFQNQWRLFATPRKRSWRSSNVKCVTLERWPHWVWRSTWTSSTHGRRGGSMTNMYLVQKKPLANMNGKEMKKGQYCLKTSRNLVSWKSCIRVYDVCGGFSLLTNQFPLFSKNTRMEFSNWIILYKNVFWEWYLRKVWVILRSLIVMKYIE